MPTAAEVFKRLEGQSKGRIWWEGRKKGASKGVDVKVFNKGLGPKIDSYRQLVKGAFEVKRLYPKLDDRTLGPVKTKKAKLDSILKDYESICRGSMASKTVTPSQRNIWSQLLKDLMSIRGDMDNWYVELVK